MQNGELQASEAGSFGWFKRSMMANRAKFTDRKRERFLEVLRETANISEAARRCNVMRRTAYNHREADPVFRAAWDEAVEEAVDRLEREAWRRGVEGVDRPITYQGKITDTYKEYSDRMLELLLKAHRPDRYKERVANEHTGRSAPTTFSELTEDELIERLMAKRRARKGNDELAERWQAEQVRPVARFGRH